MKNVFADIKYYNANTHDNNVGDCVVRSISLALGEPYDIIRSDLNATKRNLGAIKYNVPRVFEAYLKTRGIQFAKTSERLTTREFYETHSSGTYLLLTDSRKHAKEAENLVMDHMCCVIDGDLYDSWDSRNSIVGYVATVPNTPNIYEVNIADMWPTVHNDIDDYLDALTAKYSDLILSAYMTGCKQTDTFTEKFRIDIELNTQRPDMPAYYVHYQSKVSHQFVLKISPTTTESDIPRLSKSMRQKIYDWWYNIRKEIEDDIASAKIVANPYFRGDKAKLMKLPEWSRSLVSYFRDGGNPIYEDPFVVYMDALEGDPRYDENTEVEFRADTLTELKHDMERYRTDFSRFGYDY